MIKIIDPAGKPTLKAQLDSFLGQNKTGSLLQSTDWASFQTHLGRVYHFRLAFDRETLVAAVLAIEQPLALSQKYLYLPYGPVFADQLSPIQLKKINQLLLTELIQLAQENNLAFIRLEPKLAAATPQARAFQHSLKPYGPNAVPATQVQDTLILDLKSDPKILLASFHHKTRYNIRLAKKKGVTVRSSANPDDVDLFYDLIEKTTLRDQFSAHPQEYYRQQIKSLAPENARLYLAEYQGKTIAGVIVTFFGRTATYLHGASDYQYRRLMAPHLLQWTAILEAQAKDCREYDFWGVAPENAAQDHPWTGITRFKEGFGGRRVSYLGAFDLPRKKFIYSLYKLKSRI